MTLLTKEVKAGANTELRELDKIRGVVFSEPEEGAMETLRLSNIKRLTGNETQNARGLYESNSVTHIHGTAILECNALPAMTGDKGTKSQQRSH